MAPATGPRLPWLVAYAQAGGHLVVGPRTGYGDHEARARTEVMPARLAEAAGVWCDEFATLTEHLPVVAPAGSPLTLEPGSTGTRWADGLNVDGAEVLLAYDHPHYGQWAAAITHVHGYGRITQVGNVSDTALARALMAWIAPGADDGWRPAHPSLTSTSARAIDGRRVRFLHNWSWQTVSVPLPAAVQDVLGGSRDDQGEQLELRPWDVRVLVERGEI